VRVDDNSGFVTRDEIEIKQKWLDRDYALVSEELIDPIETVLLDLGDIEQVREITPEEQGFHAIFCNNVGYLQSKDNEAKLIQDLLSLLRDDVSGRNLFYLRSESRRDLERWPYRRGVGMHEYSNI